jgi:voltage-gated potassium channel
VRRLLLGPCVVVSTVTGSAATIAKSTVMADETRVERWLDRTITRTVTPRGAAIVIAGLSTLITVGAGLVMTIIDHDSFPTIGGGLWWGVQTVTTVGYGDHVPETSAGRILASLVMLLGIAFVTVITATITSSFVARISREQSLAGGDAASAEQLRKIDERLERIEAALNRRS